MTSLIPYNCAFFQLSTFWYLTFLSEIPITLASIVIWLEKPEMFLSGFNKYHNNVTHTEYILLLMLSSVTFTFVVLPTAFFLTHYSQLFYYYQIAMLIGDLIIIFGILPYNLAFGYPQLSMFFSTLIIASLYSLLRIKFLLNC